MADFAYYNITTTAVTTISAIDNGTPKNIVICNTDATGDSCVIDLFIDNADSSKTYYILHDVEIPSSSTLVLEQPEVSYDSLIYNLKFLLTSASDNRSVDVKITY